MSSLYLTMHRLLKNTERGRSSRLTLTPENRRCTMSKEALALPFTSPLRSLRARRSPTPEPSPRPLEFQIRPRVFITPSKNSALSSGQLITRPDTRRRCLVRNEEPAQSSEGRQRLSETSPKSTGKCMGDTGIWSLRKIVWKRWCLTWMRLSFIHSLTRGTMLTSL